jgi:hypothetical protein
MSLAKKAIWSLVFLLILFAVFFTGGFIGYNNGYAYRSFYASTTDAYITLRTIEAINSRKAAAAKEDLEQQLDTQIVEHWVGLVNKPLNYFSPARHDEDVVKNLMSKVAAYRKRHPSTTTDPDIKNAIEAVITLYDEGIAVGGMKGRRR